MRPSPLSFARSYEQLSSRLDNQPAADLRLLLLAEFWPGLYEFREDITFGCYFDEYPSLLIRDINEKSLTDLLPQELGFILRMILELRDCHKGTALAESLTPVVQSLAVEAARKAFYVGALKEGLGFLTQAFGGDTPLPPAEPSDEGGQRRHDPDELSELDLLRVEGARMADSNSPLASIVDGIIRDWEIQRAALSFDSAQCLFVEKNSRGEHSRGRLRTLQGSAEYRRPGATNHELTLDNQPKAPDDPLVGSIHKSLSAAERMRRANSNGADKARFIRARYRVVDSDHTFTGDSIALAAGLVAYTQLLHPEIHRHERFVALEAAFTGGLDESGRLTPVGGSLKRKIERVFFSPIRFLVLPKENLDEARRCVDEMCRVYPQRRLSLVAATTLREVIDDLNIVRAERVCMGQFVARKAYKYSRATKIQVPLLAVLIYVLICLVYARAWIWFDRNPHTLRVVRSGFEVLNADSDFLWTKSFRCDSLRHFQDRCWAVLDLNGDGRNDVLFGVDPTSAHALSGWMIAYDYNGDSVFACDGVSRFEYPGDTVASGQDGSYYGPMVSVVSIAGQTRIVTGVQNNYPGRGHIKVWDTQGRQHGWYVNSGGSAFQYLADPDSNGVEDLVCLGYQNRLKGLAVFVLPAEGAFGVSPPYWSRTDDYDLSQVKRGNQLHYLVFQPTEIGKIDLGCDYQQGGILSSLSGGRSNLSVTETQHSGSIDYLISNDFRVQAVLLGDVFRTRYRQLVERDSLPPIPIDDYADSLRIRVMYWTDSGFVTEGQLRAAGQ